MSVSQILTTYDGQEPTLCITGGGGGGGVVSVGVGAGLTLTGTPTVNPTVNLGFTNTNQLLYGTGLNTGTLLGPGAPGDFLRINNAITPALEWHPISAGGVVSVSANPGGACFVNNSNSSTPAVAIAFPAGAKGALPASDGTGVNLGQFLAGPLADGSQQNYLLSADNMSAVGFSWKAAAGTAITGEAPLVEFIDGTLSKVGINFGVGAAGIGQIPVGISSVGGKEGVLTPALAVGDDGKVLTASSADAAIGGVAWKTLTGPGGAIGTNAPLFDDYVAPNNTIGIDFLPAGVGQIPVGLTTPGGKVGTLTPALTPAQDNYVLTASSAAAAAGGVVWAPLPAAAGTVVNRASAHLGPTPILAPTAVNAEMVLVAEEPIFEFWAASGTAAAAGILPPFTNVPIFAGKIFTLRAENILVGAVSTPAIVLLDSGVPIFSLWGGSIPAYPAVNGFFYSNNPQNMVAYGDFDNIGAYIAANVGPTIPEAWRPYNIACFDADGLGGVLYDNQNRFSTGGSKGIIGGPVICAVEALVGVSTEPAWVFGGSFNALEGIALTPHNIVYIYFYPIVPNIAQWAVPVGFGTDGPVSSLFYDDPNLFIGGDFQDYGAPPATAGSPYLYRYDLTNSVPTSLPTALAGFVLNMEISAIVATRLIVYGNPNGTGPTGSRAVFIDIGTMAISASGLPPTAAVGSYPLNKASRAITSATLIVNPPAAATDLYDVIAIAGAVGDPIFVYIFSAAIGSWENTGDVLTALATNNPVCMYYDATAAPSPVLFCQADAIQYEYNQLTATPTASFTLANGFLFNSNVATTTATMNANTSQYFIAGVNGTKWICSGAAAPGLAFT